MPMIDVYASSDLLPSGSDRRIGEELTRAVLRAEGVSAPGQFHLENTAAFIHRMEPTTVQTAAQAVAGNIRFRSSHTRSADQGRTEAARTGRDNNPGRHLRRPFASETDVGVADGGGGRRLGHRRHGVRSRGICRSGGRGRKEVTVW
jgi:hypothetical protein